jgi:hypothetical protein
LLHHLIVGRQRNLGQRLPSESHDPDAIRPAARDELLDFLHGDLNAIVLLEIEGKH